jgi:hypothetical protein
MFDFIRKAVRAAREAKKPIAEQSEPQAIGLRRGGFVSVDALPFQMQRDQLLFTPPQGMQKIEAYGRIDLGAGAELHRYYLSDDAWLQASSTAGAIDEFKLWTFADTRHPADRAAFERWLAQGSELGRQSFEHAGARFQRVWGEEADWAPPVQFEEAVYTRADGIPEYTTLHHAMLFERELEAAERMEYLLVSAELTGDEYSIVFSLGVDVTRADLQIT